MCGAEAVVAEHEGLPDLDAALDLYNELVAFVRGKVAKARSATDLHAALRAMLAEVRMALCDGALYADFRFAGESLRIELPAMPAWAREVADATERSETTGTQTTSSTVGCRQPPWRCRRWSPRRPHPSAAGMSGCLPVSIEDAPPAHRSRPGPPCSQNQLDLRKFLFGGVDLRHRMSHPLAPHVPLGVVLRVVRDEPAAGAARVSAARAAPVIERPTAGTAGRGVRLRRSTLERTPNPLDHEWSLVSWFGREGLQSHVRCGRARVRRCCPGLPLCPRPPCGASNPRHGQRPGIASRGCRQPTVDLPQPSGFDNVGAAAAAGDRAQARSTPQVQAGPRSSTR